MRQDVHSGVLALVTRGGYSWGQWALGKGGFKPRSSQYMSSFNDREKAFESKFAHDQELKFKATARRNKLLGQWAAEQMGLSGDAATAYVSEVIRSDLEEPGDDDVFRKIWADFQAKSVDLSEHQLRRQIQDLMEEAIRQVEGK